MDRTHLSLTIWQAQRLHRRFGWPLWIGLLLVATALGLSAAAVQLRTQVHALRAVAATTRNTEPRPPQMEAVSAESLAAFYSSLPDEAERFSLLKRLLLQAEDNGVLPPAADYRLVAEPMTRLVRYQIGLPVKGEWNKVQDFVIGALSQMRFLALDSLLLQREGGDSATVEGRVQFSVLMVRSAPGDDVRTNSGREGRQDGEHN